MIFRQMTARNRRNTASSQASLIRFRVYTKAHSRRCSSFQNQSGRFDFDRKKEGADASEQRCIATWRPKARQVGGQHCSSLSTQSECFELKRRQSGTDELSRLRGSEECEASADEAEWSEFLLTLSRPDAYGDLFSVSSKNTVRHSRAGRSAYPIYLHFGE